ncbi:lipoprotein signal peptidase [Geothrix limicola]|uniref:Lipoprotein signal peptidase n=1 Tax=Geothrix limicola TaxID=2927978 RepID=A0ABQ5QCC1_9BACT|nr:signal peptidase II [Geothrix limicola]GLH72472.1 lipoprotein signal peptidase [Geothrix limicola]
MRRLLWLLLPIGALVADLGSKAWILKNLGESESLTVIKGFFYLTLGFNRGAIFGSLTWMPPTVRFIVFALAGVAALVYFGRLFLARDTSTWERVAMGLILGGALGNGIDRILRGAVVDFLDFVFGSWHYWTFNLADSFILVGAILYGLRMLLVARAEPKTKEN